MTRWLRIFKGVFIGRYFCSVALSRSCFVCLRKVVCVVGDVSVCFPVNVTSANSTFWFYVLFVLSFIK